KYIFVIEPGSGSGYLASDILNSLKENYPDVYENISYILIDPNKTNLGKSEEILSDHKEKVIRHKNIHALKGSFNGVVLSNEFFDALTFHRIKFKNNRPQEIYVDIDHSSFKEVLGELSSSELKDAVYSLDTDFVEDQQIEINLNYRSVIKHISRILNKGIVLTFDYGYLKGELYSPKRFDGTYRCFHNHRISSNPYINIGEQDITSSVNFSELIDAGKQFGLSTEKYTTQGQFLIDWGILDIIEKLDEKQRSTAKNLFMPGTMGDAFKALIQQKNMNRSFMGHYPESVLKISYQTKEDQI
ncbi:MAG: methyltransferase, partial [Candidatus Dadabacteria bacterium]|nr:methyltransferase [Candidatus Dadabacteria bacterium]NIT14613.1 methyltransferase [Candidatus Dadabacteria bacterium]